MLDRKNISLNSEQAISLFRICTAEKERIRQEISKLEIELKENEEIIKQLVANELKKEDDAFLASSGKIERPLAKVKESEYPSMVIVKPAHRRNETWARKAKMAIVEADQFINTNGIIKILGRHEPDMIKKENYRTNISKLAAILKMCVDREKIFGRYSCKNGRGKTILMYGLIEWFEDGKPKEEYKEKRTDFESIL